jgi:hypothetical protein
MALKIPDAPPIDRSRAGVLAVSASFIGELLRLPAGMEIVDARLSSDRSYVELLIEGAPMPSNAEGSEPRAVKIICHTAYDEATQMVTVFANFAHAPGDGWIMRPPYKREAFL